MLCGRGDREVISSLYLHKSKCISNLPIEDILIYAYCYNVSAVENDPCYHYLHNHGPRAVRDNPILLLCI